MDNSCFPQYLLKENAQGTQDTILVLKKQEHEFVPELWRKDFQISGAVTQHEGKKKYIYLTPSKAKNQKITQDSIVDFSKGVQEMGCYLGIASQFLMSAYKFSRKSKSKTLPKVYCNPEVKDHAKIINLVEARNRAKEWANGRGDQEGTPAYFEQQAKKISHDLGVQLTVIKGEGLLENGFRLMHAVGRASKNTPTFINLTYKGNPDRDDFVAYVGKGVCFDSGGLDIKTTAGMRDMFLDKHGAVSILSAFKTIVEEKQKINLTVSLGFVENFINQNSYRPADIIKSRKGLTVQIGNTDAQGRLVLADCMNWTQEKYKTAVLIELSTLTGAVITALGSKHAGLFGNDSGLTESFKLAGKQVNEQVWELPCDQYHKDLVKSKIADLTNSSGKTQASSCQAAAFLKHFVEEGVKWIHLDVAGVCIVGGEGTGYGSRILIQYARNYANL